MNRRDFLGTSVAAVVATAVRRLEAGEASQDAVLDSPLTTKLAVRPVMTNIIHSGVWEGPCRWRSASIADERRSASSRFAAWSKQVGQALDSQPGVDFLPAVHVTFDEDFVLPNDQLQKLKADGRQADAVLVAPSGGSIPTFQVGKFLNAPIIMKGLSCRTVDVAAYTRSEGYEAFVPQTDPELHQLLQLLRARKVFRDTRVLFPTDRGLPAVASVTSAKDLESLAEQHGIQVRKISYTDLAEAVEQTFSSKDEQEKAEAVANELIQNAQDSLIDARYVTRALQFYRAIMRLMKRHQCNAFTIECFEFCSSRLPEKWKVTPCLIHTLLKDQGHASSCEADFGGLLAMRLLMSIAQKSSHLGNVFLRSGGALGVNHSAPGLRMNGFDQPPLPYKLGRFVESGWGAKAVVDFMNNQEKRVTVARIDPTATRMLLLKGRLVGATGWKGDNIGCSVEARIEPLEGKAEDFIRKQLDYGNHLIWTYGHYEDQMRRLGELLEMDVEIIR